MGLIMKQRQHMTMIDKTKAKDNFIFKEIKMLLENK